MIAIVVKYTVEIIYITTFVFFIVEKPVDIDDCRK